MRPRVTQEVAAVPARPPFRRKYLVEALEPRLLLSADILPVVPPPAPDPLPDTHPVEAVVAAAGGDAHQPQIQFDATEMATDFTAAIAPDAPPASDAAPAPTEIAFVDGRVVGQDALTLQKDGMLVVVLDANQDGLAQISEILAQNHDIQAVHLIAHGDSGEMFLGTSVLDSQAIADGKVADWGKALTADGDLLLYGCDVAQGETGQTFVQQLAAATGADVGASTDATGSAAAGGNWMLEYTVGKLEAAPLQPTDFSQLLAAFAGTSGTDTFTTGNSGNDVYSFASANLTSVDTITDASGGDDLVITDAGTVVDSDFTNITGIDRLVLGNFTNSITLGSLAVTAAGTAAGGDIDIVGGSGTDSLSFAGFGSDLVFAFNTDGSIDVKVAGNTRFHVTGVENVTGGAGTDTFNYSGLSSDVSVDLQTSHASGITGTFGSIETVIGGSGTNTLSGSDVSNNVFNIQSNGDVVVGALTVKGFNALEGGAGASTVNTFKFAAAGQFNGSIAGNGLSNILDYSSYATDVTVDLTLDSAAATFANAVTGVTGTVSSDITAVVGSAHDDTITDGGFTTTFTDSGGSDSYTFGDDFGAGHPVTVTDSSGTNTLSFANAGDAVKVQFNSTNITVTQGTTSSLTASGTFGTVEGSADDDVFLAKANVTVSAVVEGGLGDDRFQVEEGSDYQGGIDGGGGSGDVVDYVPRGGSLAASTDDTLENVSGGLTGIEKIQHPYSIFDGINDFFTSLQDGIDQTIGTVSLPLVGNLNSVIGDFVSDLRDFLLGPLDDALLVNYVPGTSANPTATTVELIEHALTIDFTGSVPGATTAAFGFHIIGDPNNPDRAEFALVLEGVIYENTWDIDFSAAVPGLGISAEPGSAIELSLTYTARLAFGFDFDVNKFYFDTDGADDETGTDDDVEIQLQLEASFTDDTSIILNLGFLQFEATSYDNSDQKMQDSPGTDSPYQDDKHSGFFADFGIDLRDPGSDPQNVADGWAVNDGILTNSEFKDSHFKLKENLAAVMHAYADVDLFMRLSADLVLNGLPSIQFYFHYDQLFGEAEVTFDGKAEGSGVEAPTIVLEDLSLDLGTFFTSFLKPVLDEVQSVTQPLQPVIDFLKADIPILSDIDLLKNLLNHDKQGGVDVLDFAATILGPTKYGPVITAFNALVDLIDMVNHIPADADTILINFGTYEFGGSSNDLRDTGSKMTVPNTSGYNSGQSIAQNNAISSTTKGFLSSLTRDPVGGGFSVPILTDPAQIIKLITGKDDAVLIMYDLPQFNFDVNFHKSVPLVFPLNMVLDAGFSVTAQIGFGFDVSGIKAFAAGGYSDPALIFDGFFIDDHVINGVDQDEVVFNAHFTVGASVGVSGIIEAGVQGGITGTFGFNFNDVDHDGPGPSMPDGHIHFDELKLMIQQQGILGFLDMHGSLDWFLQAFVWVGLDLGFFGKITLYDETFDLGGGNIVTFSNHYNISIPPHVADVVGGNLVLNMGADANHRDDTSTSAGYSDTDGNVAETYDVSLDEAGTHYLVSYNGTTTSFLKSDVTGNIVVNDAQGGNDVLTVGEGVTAGLIFHGGDGDDRVSYLGTGIAQIFGDAGNDRITANSSQHTNPNRLTVAGQSAKFDTQLEGGTGNDQLTITNVDSQHQTDGNAYVHGGSTGDAASVDSGNDKIKTRGGDDVILGGNEPGLTGGKANGDIIDAGAGNDTIFGGTGSDSIKGGDGNDVIDGGDETVNIVRNSDGSINTGASTGLSSAGKALGDAIDGGDGNDTVYAGAGFDTIRGGAGDDTIRGGSGDDNITGGQGVDAIFGDGANFSGDGSASSRTGNDTINWSSGDANDSTIDAGSGNDAVILAGANVNTAFSLTASGSNVTAAWTGGMTNTLTLIGVEKATLNAGTGADTITVNDLAATTLRELSISLGSAVQNVLQYDVNGDGQYHALPAALLDSNGHLQTTTDSGGLQHLVYANGTSLTDVPAPMRNQDGEVLFTVNDNGTPDDHISNNGDETLDDFQDPVYNDDGIASKIVSQSVVDSSADKVIVNGSSIADNFVLSNTAVAGSTSPSYTLTRSDASSTLLSLSVAQGNFAADTLTVNGLTGNDTIDASKVTTGVAELHLNGGDGNGLANDGNDRIIGSQLADKINGGFGNDTITGNAGLDVFSDDGGTDTLSETRDKDYDLSSNTLKIGAASAGETEDVSLFERFTLTGGASANVLNVHDFNKTAVLDGAGGGDQYIISFMGSGSSSITEQDSGGTSGSPDSMIIYGTSGDDTIQSLAVTPTSGTISEVNGSGATPPTEVVRYNVTETLIVDGLGGNDVFSIDDTSMEINFLGNDGNDKFTVGHVESEIVYHDAWLLSSGNLLFVITIDSATGKPIHPITGLVDSGATLSAGSWTFSDGFVAQVVTIDLATHQAIDPSTGLADPGAVLYDEINVADKLTNGITYKAFLFGGDGADSFEVNHNLAELFLNGDDGDDRFVINANLTNDAQSNIAGGDGTNHIEYVQNAKVFIDGGLGFDVVVINGTSIGDTFIITTVVEDLIDGHGNFILDGSGHHVQGEVQKVVGAGLQIGKIANVERLEVNGGGGADKFYVYGTLPGMDLVVSGGSGDDIIYVGGDTISVTGVTPAHFEQPPTIPAYDETQITYQQVDVDPPGYYYWDWDFPYLHFYDPPSYSYLEPIISIIHHDEVTPSKVLVPAQAYTFTQNAKYDVTGIKGTFSIDGEDGNDSIFVNNQDGANTTATKTGSLDLNTVIGSSSSTDYTALSGFGVAAGEKINIVNAENLTLNLGAFDDQLTITHTDAVLTTNVNLGNGANTVDVTASAGDLNITGGTGSDKLNLGSLAPNVANGGTGTLANITGVVTFAAGGGGDTLNLDNDGNATPGTTTVTGSTISNTAVFGGVSSYTGVETLNINLGGGADVINVTGTSAVTTINANGGNDVINVSSDGATLQGTLDSVAQTLNLHAGTGNNTLNVSDFGDGDADASVVVMNNSITGLAPATINYDAVSGRFTGGINIWAGTGNDGVTISSTTLTDVTTFYGNAGNDTITVANLSLAGGSNRFLSIHGDAGNDTIDASAITALDFTVLLFGDSGQETYSGADKQFISLTAAASVSPATGGTDTLKSGNGRGILIGGTGSDTLTTKDSSDVLIGDNGSVQLASGVVTQFNSTDTNGGVDTITAAGGANYIVGGVGGDGITALTGTNDVVFGDNGTATFTSAGVIVSALSADLGSGGADTINVGDGNNVVVGGAGNDTITTLDGVDVVIGDNGSATWTLGVLTQFKSTDTTAGTGGDDTIGVGNGSNYVIGGVGVDNTTAGTGNDVVLGDNGIVNFAAVTGVITDAATTQDGLGGGENLNVGGGNNVVIGGAGGDTVAALGGVDVVIGDNGSATWTLGVLTQFKSSDTVATTGGNDTIGVGDGRNYVVGGVGVDNTTAGTGDDVVLGDNGIVNFAAVTGIITDAVTTQDGLGGGENLNVGDGNNVVVGGAGNDTIIALDGIDVVLGDNGSATWTLGVLTQFKSSDTVATTGGDDTIGVGNGRNYVIGGVGVDNTTAGTGDDVVLGDNGIVNFAAVTGIVTDAATTQDGLGAGENLSVGDGNNVVLGGAGNDTIASLDGVDVVIGDNGSAAWTGTVLTQFKSSDSVATTGGDDTIDVGNGANYVIGGVGIDGIDAGTGNDVVLGDSGIVNFTSGGVITDATITTEGTGGDDTIDVDDGNNVVLAGDGDDGVTALDGTDVVIGDNGQAVWTGGTLTMFTSNNTGLGGDDTINIGTTALSAGKNYAIGGVGKDTITGGQNDDVVLGDNGIVNFTSGGVIIDATVLQIGTGDVDTIDMRDGNNVVLAGAGGDSVTAGSGIDVVIGDNGSATWTGTVLTQFKSSDSVATTGGDDTIDVGGGSNYVIGGVGIDGIDAGTGNDVVLGDSGIVNFTSGGVIIDATITTEGTGGDDTIDVSGGDNVVLAGDGVDDVTALDGEDVVIGDNGQAVWTGGTLTMFTSNNTGVGGDDTINIGTTAATAGKNYVIGGVGRDTITGGQNDDVVLGDNGIVNFTSGGVITDATVLQIGTGDVDTIDVRGGNNVVLAGAGGDSVTALGGLDIVIGDNGQATWTGGTLTQFKSTDSVATTGGDDTIDVGGGNNYVIGGVGVDGITSGAGNDVVLGDSGVVNFTSTGVITDATVTTDGTGGVDTIDVGGGDNVVLAGDAGDTVTALDGSDVVIGDNGQAVWTGGTLTMFTSANTGTGGDDTINVGTTAATAGKNYVIGGVGVDGITGGENDDVVLGDNGVVNFTPGGVITDATVLQIGTGDVDTIDVRGGNNVVLAGAGGDSVTAGAGTDVVIGDNGAATWAGGIVTQIVSSDTTAGTGGDDTIAAGDGRNYVIGGVGVDGITSGTGNDVVLGDNGVVNFTSAGVITEADATELGLGDVDTIDAGEGNNVIIGGAAGDTVTSGAGNDVIVGDNGHLAFAGGVLMEAVTTDTTDATGGNDTITAGGGNNVVLAGVGDDDVTTGSGNDVVIGDNGIAQFDGTGRVTMVEARDPLRIGNDTISVGSGNDVVIGGGGTDTIFGGAGNDVLIGDGGRAEFSAGVYTMVIGDVSYGAVDFVDGGAGNDILLGGAGDDTLVANLTDDLFTGGNARISFASGLVTTIEVLDGVDLVLQALFDSYSTPQQDSVVIEENNPEGEGGGGTQIGTLLADSIGAEGIFASDGTALLPGNGALTFSFGRPVPLSQVPEMLRNIVLELSLGAGVPPPAHGGESGGQGQAPAEGGNTSNPDGQGASQGGPEEPNAAAPVPFALEAEASTLAPENAADEAPVVVAAAAAIAGLARPAARPVLEREAFAPRRIDW